ncbi:MAG: FAD-dependent oxidoreductase, partial [Thermoleophilia bacterium]|nr:FAD-dependent oxidoreductase [Thermoleophilia bacterium]
MALSSEIYRAFADVVGDESICDDPVMMAAYFKTDFAAVIMPKDTVEVQAVIRLCNKFRLQFRPICTGWTGVFVPGTVLLDLRRMDKIVEIDEKNMYAVVEPYVTSAQLQAELFKRGLNTNIKGAGAQCSAMLRGHGHLDQSCGADDRNHLAVEWITPDGELVKMGSCGSVNEWFCGDGPGPSLRSLVSSVVPPSTTPGVLTKVAMKLYHWPGPARYPLKGYAPRYTLAEHPANMMARYYSFPTLEQMWQAEISLGEAEVCYELMGFNAAMVSANISNCNEQEMAMFNRLSKEVQGPGFFVIIAGHSQADYQYKKKVLETIVADNDGRSLGTVEDPEIEGILLTHCTRISASVRETFRPGGYFKSIPVMGQRDLTIRWAIGAGQAKLPLIEKGLIADDGGGFFGWGVEQGHLGKTEIFCAFSPMNPEAWKVVDAWEAEQGTRALEEKYFA